MSRQFVHSAPSGQVGFDTDTTLSASTAAAFVAGGFHFAVRYLSRGSESPADLTSSEVTTILNAGLALSAVQHVSASGWQPTQELGEQYGKAAAQNAESAGLAPGMNLWLDLEGVESSTSASDVSAYCNAWFGEVAAAKYVPGLYVGAGSILNADELDALNVEYFWKSACSVPYPSNGYCMVQSIGSSYVIDGVAYDRDVVQKNNLEHTPLMMGKGKLETPSADRESGQTTMSKKSSLLPWAGTLLAALASYAAGVYTGPMILPSKTPVSTSAIVKTSPSAKTTGPVHASPAPPATGTTQPAATGTTQPVQPPPAPQPAKTEPRASITARKYVLLVGSFGKNENAEGIAKTLQAAGYNLPEVSQTTARGQVWYVVRLGPYLTLADADQVAGQLKERYRLTAIVQGNPE